MMEQLRTTLQAMYSGGSVSGFIIAAIPEGRLESGWIEHSLVAKVLLGDSKPKASHEDYLIPADRTVRLMRDRGAGRPFGIVMIGEPGVYSKRFNVIHLVQAGKSGVEQYLSAFWTQGQTPSQVMNLFFSETTSQKTQDQRDEPIADYIEQLRVDASNGFVIEAMSARLPSGRAKTDEWLRESLTRPVGSESVHLRFGEMKAIPTLAKLFSTWISSLDLAKRTDPLVGSMILPTDDAVELVMWDGARGIVTFAVVKSLGPKDLAVRFLSPMWSKAGESATQSTELKMPETPERAVSKGLRPGSESPDESPGGYGTPAMAAEEATPEESELYRRMSKRLDSIGAEDLESRLAILESEVRRLTHEQAALAEHEASSSERVAANLLQSRLKEILERLEFLSDKMAKLEERAERLLSKGS